MIAWLLGSRIGRMFEAILAAAGLLAGAVLYGKAIQKKSSQIKDLKSYVETTKKVDAVAPSADSHAAVQRMRKNGWIR